MTSVTTRITIYGLLIFLAAVTMQTWLSGTGDIVLVANVIALATAVWIVYWYQVNTDWQANLIGRTTMGIKGIFVLMGVAGILRRSLEFEVVYTNADAYLFLHRFGEGLQATAWVLTAILLLRRLDALKALKDWSLERQRLTTPEPANQSGDEQ